MTHKFQPGDLVAFTDKYGIKCSGPVVEYQKMPAVHGEVERLIVNIEMEPGFFVHAAVPESACKLLEERLRKAWPDLLNATKCALAAMQITFDGTPEEFEATALVKYMRASIAKAEEKP